ncbi:MAG TPA: hypothetical protein VGP31_07330 [Planosporangium sp.]|nr:hypothetical protein [Planosporangium sp.]
MNTGDGAGDSVDDAPAPGGCGLLRCEAFDAFEPPELPEHA